MRSGLSRMALAIGCLGFVPRVVFGQAGIAGVVRIRAVPVAAGSDRRGAASPALIEKVRTAVSNEQGQDHITDLRPGYLQRHIQSPWV